MRKQDDISLIVEVDYDRDEDGLAVPGALVVAFDDKGAGLRLELEGYGERGGWRPDCGGTRRRGGCGC